MMRHMRLNPPRAYATVLFRQRDADQTIRVQYRFVERLFSSTTTNDTQKNDSPSRDDVVKNKEEMAAKLKQALLDASKQVKKKPLAPATAAQTPSSGPSTPFSSPSPDTPTLGHSPSSTSLKAGAAVASGKASSAAQAPAVPPIKRESTFERLGERLKRAFTDGQKSFQESIEMPPPNAVKVSPHIVTRSQVTPASNLLNLLKNVTISALKSTLLLPPMLWRATLWIGRNTWSVIKDPTVFSTGSAKLWKSIKHEAAHYWTGFKILGLELRTSSRLMASKLQGKQLTRREQQQLQRTFTDVLRMGPFLVFVIVPFMEFTLPIFLKLFPNMLPSPFIDEKQKDMTRKNIGQLRLEMASFMQEMVAEVESKVRDKGADAKTISALVQFVERSRNNEPIPADTLPVLIKTFSDELTIERMSREKLQMMCRFMGVSTIGSDDFLRYSLLSRLRAVRADDVQISWEGVESLSLEELKSAALERGMQAESNDIQHYRRQLARWIELSVVHNVSPAMLILSRAFAVAGPAPAPSSDPQEQVKQVLSSLEPEIVQDALVSAVDDVTNQPKIDETVDRNVLQKAKLESIKRENELIEEETDENKQKQQLQLQAQEGQRTLGNAPTKAVSTVSVTAPLGTKSQEGHSLPKSKLASEAPQPRPPTSAQQQQPPAGK